MKLAIFLVFPVGEKTRTNAFSVFSEISSCWFHEKFAISKEVSSCFSAPFKSPLHQVKQKLPNKKEIKVRFFSSLFGCYKIVVTVIHKSCSHFERGCFSFFFSKSSPYLGPVIILHWYNFRVQSSLNLYIHSKIHW